LFVQAANQALYMPSAEGIALALVVEARKAREATQFSQSLDSYRAAFQLFLSINRAAAAKLSIELAGHLIELGLFADAKNVLEMFEPEYQSSEAVPDFRFAYLEAISAIQLLQCKFLEAEEGLREAIVIASQIGLDGQSLANTRLLLCIALAEQNKDLDEAETLCLSVLRDLDTRKFLAPNPYALHTLCKVILSRGNYELAEKLARISLERAEDKSLDAAFALAQLGDTYRRSKQIGRSIDCFCSSMNILASVVGRFHHLYGTVSLNLAEALIQLSRYSEASELLQHAGLVFEMANDKASAEAGLVLLSICQDKA
jgi:tetratricopeptide (TPR) repeat protein